MVVHYLEILYFKCVFNLCYCLSHGYSTVSGYAVFWTDMQFFVVDTQFFALFTK